jgi:predicted molibdopterin-dependent oxidoreductase YjgC
MIDNSEVEVADGGTILDAARKLGIEIPTMCFLEGVRANASCMLCVVKVEGHAGLVPACATLARDGMKVQTDTDEVRQARKDALELLLSDHLGDCEGPCRLACPAGLNIPLIIRQIAAGETGDAAGDSEIPCNDCPAPCERACRRKQFDSPVSIRALMQYAAAAGLAVQPSEQDNRRRFSVHMGRLREGEMEQFLAGANQAGRVEPSAAGLTEKQARDEARRCLHCDCRKADACKLRDYSEIYGAKARRYKGERRSFVQNREHPDVIYEPGKCIACGLCVRIAEEAREELGLTFIGRGFDVRVAVPFDRSIAEGLKTTALQCAAACPTGALSQR